MKSDRRLKMFYLQPEAIINCIISKPSGEYVNRLNIEGLPLDYSIKNINFDNVRYAFAIIVSHPSFDEVSDYACIPMIDVITTGVQMKGYRVFPDLPKYPDPEIEMLSETYFPNGHISQVGAIKFADNVAEQMKRYGIIGWDDDGVAIWEHGRGPIDPNVSKVIRSKQDFDLLTYKKDHGSLNGKFIETRQAFRKPDVAPQPSDSIPRMWKALTGVKLESMNLTKLKAINNIPDQFKTVKGVLLKSDSMSEGHLYVITTADGYVISQTELDSLVIINERISRPMFPEPVRYGPGGDPQYSATTYPRYVMYWGMPQPPTILM